MGTENYIYGAGNFGKKLFAYFKSIGGGVRGFIQSDEPENAECMGLEVISFDRFCKRLEQEGRSKEIRIAVAIKNDESAKEIYEKLRGIGIRRDCIWRYKEFLDAIMTALTSDVRDGYNSCNICGERDIEFIDSQARGDASFFRQHKMIGAGSRKNCICPICGAIDRHRFVYWILQNKTDVLYGGNKKILHFAPEKSISDILGHLKNIDYYPCDLVPKSGAIQVDATDIPFKDNVFDFVIINHVMEHIPNERLALNELHRVLKTDGILLLSIPICCDIAETYEDNRIVTKEERSKYYGQEDHVRLYGLDYKERFSKGGFRITAYTPNEELDEDTIKKYGFIENDVVMLCRKNETPH